jgi:hypothetical protein
MYITPNYSSTTAVTTDTLSSSDESGEELMMSDLIAQGLAPSIYGCTTSQQILDRLSGKSPYVDPGSTEATSSNATSSVYSNFNTYL